jgi:sirohydrochlorin ferrochelatase
MTALLLIAHGSRREESNQEVRDLGQRLMQVAGERFESVVTAFLELAEPDIPGGVNRCVATGATQVVAVPYFLAAGRHVITDIPEQLDKARRQHPGLDLRQCDYLGRHDGITEILLAIAQGSMFREEPPAT